MSRARQSAPYFTAARFPNTCPETGKAIAKGDTIAYFPATGRAYAEASKAGDQVRGLEFAAAYCMRTATN